MISKGRYPSGSRHWTKIHPGGTLKGELNPGAKLRDEDIPEIIKMLESGLLQKDVGEVFGVGQQAISKIYSKKHWAHIQLPVTQL